MSTSSENDPEFDAVAALWHELWRYRLALTAQVGRVASAMESLRGRRDEIEERMQAELFGPTLPPGEFERRIQHLASSDLAEIGALKTEVQFLLVAVHGIDLMSRSVGESVTDEPDCVKAALARFEEQAPDARLLRNIHEHLEEYVLGKGRQQGLLPAPMHESVAGMIEDKGVAYYIGGKLFITWEIADATETLAAAVIECLKRRFA